MLTDCIFEEDDSHVRRPVGRTGRVILYTDEIADLLKRSYGVLACVHNCWPGRNSDAGQKLLCELRDAIAEITETDAQTVQDSANSYKPCH